MIHLIDRFKSLIYTRRISICLGRGEERVLKLKAMSHHGFASARESIQTSLLTDR